MNKVHDVGSIGADQTYLYLAVDGQTYRIRWIACSPRLARATLRQRGQCEVSPSGYGLHWSEIDEDLAITPLLEEAEALARDETLLAVADLLTEPRTGAVGDSKPRLSGHRPKLSQKIEKMRIDG